MERSCLDCVRLFLDTTPDGEFEAGCLRAKWRFTATRQGAWPPPYDSAKECALYLERPVRPLTED